MKPLLKYITLLIIPIMVIGVSGCSKDDDKPNNGTPAVHYIRSTDPALSDSLLVGSFMGSLIAIVGENLGSKSREVRVKTELELEQILLKLREK